MIPFLDDPEFILRIARQNQKMNQDASKAASEPQPLTHANLAKLTGTVEPRPSSESLGIDDCVFKEVPDKVPDDILDEGVSVVTQDTMALFYGERGHLPPLDKEVTAMLNAIANDPTSATTLAKKLLRRSPGTFDFTVGLEARNTSTLKSRGCDPYKDHVININTPGGSSQETEEEKSSFELLWNLDQAKCSKPEN